MGITMMPLLPVTILADKTREDMVAAAPLETQEVSNRSGNFALGGLQNFFTIPSYHCYKIITIVTNAVGWH